MSLRRRASDTTASRAASPALAALVAFCVSSALACGNACGHAPAQQDAGPAAPEDTERPPTQAELPTTDGSITLDNLNGQIKGLETAVAMRPRDVDLAITLSAMVANRGKYLGVIADYERADALAEGAVRDNPKSVNAFVQRAATRASLHRFADALADLAEAEKLGAKPSVVRGVKASILLGQGDLEGALALRHAAREERADTSSLAAEAAVLSELGRTDEAVALFKQALASQRDVSALPVVWILFHEGVLWERAGHRERARAFFAAAHERLPSYAHAASHLAAFEPLERGIELLSAVVAASDDPEFELLLAQRLRRKGDVAEADKRIAHVRARYDELVAKHRAAFAEHAASFWLDEAKDPKKALDLAKANLEIRKTPKAYEIALLAATAAGASDDACALAAEVVKLPRASEMLKGIAAKACRKP